MTTLTIRPVVVLLRHSVLRCSTPRNPSVALVTRSSTRAPDAARSRVERAFDARFCDRGRRAGRVDGKSRGANARRSTGEDATRSSALARASYRAMREADVARVLGPRLPAVTPSDDTDFDCCVIGIGRLGLCFALMLERAGMRVVGVDVNDAYVKRINEKALTSVEPGVRECLMTSERFQATTDLKQAVKSTRLVFILVATPTDGGKHYYDHSALSSLLVKLNEFKLKDTDLVINSTVFPGYIRNIGSLLLKDCVNCPISYNPAFVAQGDVMIGYRTGGWFGMVLVGAANDEIALKLKDIYQRISGAGGSGQNGEISVCTMSPESAEICKLASNCFRTTKISFANMIGDIADRTEGAEKHEICDALKMDRSIGSICMTPGYGFGGPCYPRDNKALALYARQLGVQPLIPVATDEYNSFHHGLMVENFEKSSKNCDAPIEFHDVTYKPNCAVPMIDHSPKLEVARELAHRGKKVKIIDRFEVILEVMKEYGNLFEYETRESTVARSMESKDTLSAY